MNHRERFNALLNYQPYDRLPVICFGYWEETLEKWVEQKYISQKEIEGSDDGNEIEQKITTKLGFDYNFLNILGDKSDMISQIYPRFDEEVIETLPNGHQKIRNKYGIIEIHAPGAQSIHEVADVTLKDRESWEEHYKHRLEFNEDRFDHTQIKHYEQTEQERELPLGLFCGSMLGALRDILSLEGMSYMMVDDEDLFDEICCTFAQLNQDIVKWLLDTEINFDFAHFWEDICFKNGPLINPEVFRKKIGPNYKKITDYVRSHGIEIISLDCDGLIDSLVPTWFDNGVNTLCPIEYGTWQADIRPFREKYGKSLRGIGGMEKHVLAQDRAAVDKEIERLRPLVELGGYLPCPDHRIAPDAEWDLVLYYTERMHRMFG